MCYALKIYHIRELMRTLCLIPVGIIVAIKQLKDNYIKGKNESDGNEGLR